MDVPVLTPHFLAFELAAITQLLRALANGITPMGRPCKLGSACSSQAAKKPSKSTYRRSGLSGFRTSHIVANIWRIYKLQNRLCKGAEGSRPGPVGGTGGIAKVVFWAHRRCGKERRR